MIKSTKGAKFAYGTYTLSFLVLVSLMYGIFVLTGKSFIWQGDGLAQHYPILVRFYDWLHQGNLGGWSWNLGLGADKLTTFSYYVLGDPFSYLIALFPKRHLELGYNLLILVRLYCSGLAFMLFARQRAFQPSSRLMGTLAYTFTGFSLYVSIRHPFFLLPMMLFPLLAYGIDHVYRGRSWLPLAVFTGLALLSNFYFAYVLAIGSLAYAVLRYGAVKPTLTVRVKTLLLRLISAGGLGALLGSVLFVPSALAVLNSTRTTTRFANGYWLYPFNYYLRLPNALLTTGNPMSFWVNLGVSGLTFLALVYTLSHFKRYLWLNVGLTLLGVGLLLPAVAAGMNGGTTPSQRWLLLGCLGFGLAVMTFCDHLLTLTHRDLLVLVVATVGLIIVVWAANGFILNNDTHDLVLYGYLFLTLGVVLLGALFRWPARKQAGLLIGVLGLNLVANSYGYFSPNSGGASQHLVPRGVATKFQKDYYDGAQAYVKSQKGFSRSVLSRQYYYANEAKTNLGMNLGTHDIMSYFSVQNGAVGAFSTALDNAQFQMNKPLNQADSRTTMSNLLGVKYIFARTNQRHLQALPYGYHPVKRHGKMLVYRDKPVHNFGNNYGTMILKSNTALPLVYLQSRQLTPRQFSRLNGIDRERALTAGALVAGKTSKAVPTTTYHSPVRRLAYRVRPKTATIINSFDRLAAYRRQGNQLDPDKVTTAQQALTRKNRDRSVSLETDRYRLGRLIHQNQRLLQRGRHQNRSGLRAVTSDNQAQPITYQLRLNRPQKTAGTELYLELDGIQTQRLSVRDKYQAKRNTAIFQNRAFTGIQRLNTLRHAIWRQSDGAYTVKVTSFKNVTGYHQLGQTNLSDYQPKRRVLLNLGYTRAPRHTVTVSFRGVKGLTFKSAKLLAVPFDRAYTHRMTQLKHQGLQHLRLKDGEVTGTSRAARPTILTTSIPYSTGWQLIVDGRKTPLKRVNVGFVGATLPAGTHRVRLVYQTPGFRTGLGLTLLGLSLLGGLSGYTWWQRR